MNNRERRAMYACRRKEGYSKKEAEEKLIYKFAKNGRVGHMYMCDHCGWWHITRKGV